MSSWTTQRLVTRVDGRLLLEGRGAPRRLIAPHAHLTSRRIGRARTLLLDGWDAGAVAAEFGFHNQSHLTRHVRTTPGRFARSRSGVAHG
jgi:AraC-like DNA-binding protein